MLKSWISPCLALFAVVVLVSCSNPEADKQRYLESGNQFLAQQKYPEAIVEYRNAVKIDDRFGEARYKLAEAYAGAGQVREAYREYIRAADLLPANDDVQLKAATALSFAGSFEDARTRVQRVLDRNSTNVEAQILMGNILAGLKDIEGAVNQIEEAIQIDPSRGATYTNLGVLRLAQGQREAARAAFDKAVEVDPKSSQARLALAMFELQTGDAAAAEQTLKHALELDPNDPLANRVMAALYLASNRSAEAEPYLKAFAAATPSPQATFLLADYYAAMGRDADAHRVLTPLIDQQATANEAAARLARIEYAQDPAAAHARIDGVLARNAQHVESLLTKARWLLAEKKRDEALTRAQAAAKASPDNPAAHYLVGIIHSQMQNSPAAIAAFNEVLRLNPRVAAAQLQLSHLQLAQGATAEAVRLAESALKNAPDSAEARLTLAGGLVAQRDFARSEPLVAALVKEYPAVAAVRALEGMQYLAKKNFPAARAAYEQALQLDRRSYPALAGLTALDMVAKDTAAARARVEASLAQSPDDVRLLLLASRVFVATNEAEKAERLLRRAIQVAPSDSTAYSMLGQIYISQRRLEEARTEFDSVASRNPKDVGVRTLSAVLSHSSNQIDDAKTRYRAVLELDPSAAVAANNLAWILAEEGKDLDEALQLAQRAAARAPERAEIHDTVGWIYLRRELPALAIPAFEKSVKQDPDNALYHYHLALAHARTGSTADARRAIAAALRLKPDYEDAKQLQATLRD